MREAVWRFGNNTQADQTAPILPEKHCLIKIKLLHQCTNDFDVFRIAIIFLAHRLIRAPKSCHIRHNDAITGIGQGGNHMAEQIAPSRLTMKQ